MMLEETVPHNDLPLHKKMYNLKEVAVVLLALCSIIIADDDPIVELAKGRVKGHILKSEQGKTYYAYQEIPYAAPPTGSNRFQPPKQPDAWTGIRDATKNNVICYQESVEHPNLKKSEDCLYINVYTPAAPNSDKKLPVLVWIHGGRFMRHAGTFQYVGPKFVINEDVIVVSFNYRMGPFGFLSTADDVIPANLGLKDQHLALEWVHDNIIHFGGDNSKVTIAGESSGGMSVCLHLLGPWKNNRQLFQAAILQSGSLTFIGRHNSAKQTAISVAKKIDRSFSSENSKDILNVLQKATADQLLEATKDRGAWMPFLEKTGQFRLQTWEALLDGNVKKIPILIGFNSEEMVLQATNPGLKHQAAALDQNPSGMLPFNFNISRVNRNAATQLLKKIYTSSNFADHIGAYIRYLTDNGITNSAIKYADLHSKYADVYLYQFAYKGQLGERMDIPYIEGCERVGHAEDLNYLWDDEINSDLSKFPAEDSKILHRFVRLWTNFVKYHNPTPEDDELLQNVRWPKLTGKSDDIPYINMNETLEVLKNPRYYQKVNQVIERYVTPKDII